MKNADRFQSTPCRRCGDTWKYNSSRACITCTKKRGTQHGIDYPEAKRERSRGRRRNILEGWAPGEHKRAEALRPSVTECACCHSGDPRSTKGWQADHDHQTGMFRGYLCLACNSTIGYVEKNWINPNKEILEYLETINTTSRAPWRFRARRLYEKMFVNSNLISLGLELK